MDEMNRLIRGLPEPESGDEPQDTAPQTGREWFDEAFGRTPETPDGGDTA